MSTVDRKHLNFDELMKRGYQLPFYADLSRMPEAGAPASSGA